MDCFVSCPFCHLTLPRSQIERHADGHFDEYVIDDENEPTSRGLKSDQHLTLAPSSLTSDQPMDEQIHCLISLQHRASFHHVKAAGGLMGLLRNCLELEGEDYTTLLSGYVDHFQSMPSEDFGWGCGWRNIQMLASHLLSYRPDARQILFAGSAFVPDIPFLQRWLEIAWEKGFDALGSHHFNHSIYGSKRWIGATECAALFRSFGLRARIVDFGPKELESCFLSVPGNSCGSQFMSTNAVGKRNAVQVYGPMDRYLLGRNGQFLQPSSVANYNSHPLTNLQNGSDRPLSKKNSDKKGSRQVLIDWVWNYFSEEGLTTSAHHGRLIVSDRPPLYFQHDGHSRTIVGIQVRNQGTGMPQYNLLILDPSHRTAALERSLEENVGWQSQIKRGVHTLKKPLYQLCYIDPGIASGEEMEQLKTINSVFIKF